jgi:Flp pilus assembly protein TadD
VKGGSRYSGKFHQAIEDYSAAINAEPDNAFAYYNRGISYDRLKEFGNAYEGETFSFR